MKNGRSREPVKAALILVVEDDEPIRFLVTEGLASFGYSTLEAEDATKALKLLEQHPVDLVLVDVGLSGEMDGAELAFEIKSRWPTIEIIVGSGSYDPKSARLPIGSTFIAKPYRWHSLNMLITQQLLKQRSASRTQAE